MRKVPMFSWVLVAFFFFGGLAFAVWDETSWIGLGQIWMATAVVMAIVFLGVGGNLKGKFGGKFSSGGPATDAGDAVISTTGAAGAGESQAEQLARLERLRASGDLSDAEYQAQRQRIISQT